MNTKSNSKISSEFFEEIYAKASGSERSIPWQSGTHRSVREYPKHKFWPKEIETILVVGCGLGDDAEYLSKLGYKVSASDASQTAIRWAKKRYPESKVNFFVDDLSSENEVRPRDFDLVIEVRVLQSISKAFRSEAAKQIVSQIKEQGFFLSVCRRRENLVEDTGPPWALTQKEWKKHTKGLQKVHEEKRNLQFGLFEITSFLKK